jgi:hypothetical protein
MSARRYVHVSSTATYLKRREYSCGCLAVGIAGDLSASTLDAGRVLYDLGANQILYCSQYRYIKVVLTRTVV